MPANLTPDYERAEQRYRQAASDEEKLEALREMLATVPKHKGTEKIQADIKRRISQLRKAAGKKGGAKGFDPFHVPKSGAGQVVLLGAPNVGKSRLVAATTNAPVKVADYPFTTQLPAPGMWDHGGAQIQLIDTPPVTAEHVPAGLWGTVRSADVLAVVVNAAGAALDQADTVLELLAGRDLRLVSRPQDERDEADGQAVSGLLVATQADRAAPGDVETLRELYADRLEVHGVSAATGEGLDALRQRLWELLAVIRVYSKEPGRPADMDKPFTLPRGATIEDLACAIHRELPERLKFARIWGPGRYDGQQVHRTEVLHDGDVVELHE